MGYIKGLMVEIRAKYYKDADEHWEEFMEEVEKHQNSGNKDKLEKLKAIAEKHIARSERLIKHYENVVKRYEDWLKRCKKCSETRKKQIREFIAKFKEIVEGQKAVNAHYEKELEDIEKQLEKYN